MRPPGLRTCANHDCHTEFKRLGDGRIYTMPVTEPQAWGLPPHSKQKVVWLCGRCAMTKEVQFDRQHFQVLVMSRERASRKTA